MQYAICFNALGCMYCNVSQCMRVEKATEGTLPQFAAQGLNGFIKAMCDPLCTYVECAYSTCRTHAHIFESARLCISRCSSLSLSALSLPPFSLLYLSFCLSNQFYSLMCVCVCVCHPVPMVRICAVKPLQKIQRTYFKFKRVLNDILPATESIQDFKKSSIEFPVGSCRNHVGSIGLTSSSNFPSPTCMFVKSLSTAPGS